VSPILPTTKSKFLSIKARKEDIIEKLSVKPILDENYMPFGDGHSAEKITSIITNFE